LNLLEDATNRRRKLIGAAATIGETADRTFDRLFAV
jgi:hypothetical protein